MCIIETRTREEDKYSLELGGFIKFDLPEELPNGRKLQNNKDEAIWFYLNVLDSFSTMSSDRMFNADDVNPVEILDLAREKKPYWVRHAEEADAS
jgi:hypothetical protein